MVHIMLHPTGLGLHCLRTTKFIDLLESGRLSQLNLSLLLTVSPSVGKRLSLSFSPEQW